MGKNKKKPNKQGKILIHLSQQKIYPDGVHIQGDEKTAIFRLRNALLKLIPLSDDPFYRPNPHEGWMPRFTLIYDVDNADKRAKEKAIYVNFDDKVRSDDIDTTYDTDATND